jgi:hypothetical protein
MNEAMRCARCGEVIGVYEPLVALIDGRPLETSLLAELAPDPAAGTLFHRACFVELCEGGGEADR